MGRKLVVIAVGSRAEDISKLNWLLLKLYWFRPVLFLRRFMQYVLSGKMLGLKRLPGEILGLDRLLDGTLRLNRLLLCLLTFLRLIKCLLMFLG